MYIFQQKIGGENAYFPPSTLAPSIYLIVRTMPLNPIWNLFPGTGFGNFPLSSYLWIGVGREEEFEELGEEVLPQDRDGRVDLHQTYIIFLISREKKCKTSYEKVEETKIELQTILLACETKCVGGGEVCKTSKDVKKSIDLSIYLFIYLFIYNHNIH